MSEVPWDPLGNAKQRGRRSCCYCAEAVHLLRGSSQPLIKLRVHCQKASGYISSFSRLTVIVDQHGCCSWAGKLSFNWQSPVTTCSRHAHQPSFSLMKLEDLVLVLKDSRPSSAHLMLGPPAMAQLLQKFWSLFTTQMSRYLVGRSCVSGSLQPFLSASKGAIFHKWR